MQTWNTHQYKIRINRKEQKTEMPSTIQPEKKNALIKVRKKLTMILNAIDDMLNGESEVSVCQKNNINLSQFRRFISNKYLAMNYTSAIKTYHDNTFLTAYDSLYLAIIEGMPRKHFYYENMPGHLQENLIETMDETLTSDEKDVLHRHYIKYESLEQIGKSKNVSREYIRLIKEKALEKLRYEEVFNKILYGKKAAAIIEAKRIENTDRLIKLKLDELNSDTKLAKSFDIKNINMSKRLRNALETNNITNLTELLYHTYDEIAHFDNIGEGTLKELDDICEKYHVPFKQYASTLSKEEQLYDINFIKMSPRLKNALIQQDIFDIRNIATMTETDIKHIPAIGTKSYNELISICDNLGIKIAS